MQCPHFGLDSDFFGKSGLDFAQIQIFHIMTVRIVFKANLVFLIFWSIFSLDLFTSLKKKWGHCHCIFKGLEDKLSINIGSKKFGPIHF